MLRTFLIFILGAVGAYGWGRCPGEYMHKLMGCSEPRKDITDGEEMCRIAFRELDCTADIMENCSDKPEIARMAGLLNIDQTRAMLNAQCGDGEDRCPAEYMHKLRGCSEPREDITDGEEMCRLAFKELDCTADIMEKCGDKPEIVRMARFENIDQTRAMLNAQCSGGNMRPVHRGGHGSNNGNSGNDVNDGNDGNGNCQGAQQRLMNCIGPMTSTEPKSKADHCRVAGEAVQCLEEIMSTCAGNPEVQEIAGMFNVDSMKSDIDRKC